MDFFSKNKPKNAQNFLIFAKIWPKNGENCEISCLNSIKNDRKIREICFNLDKKQRKFGQKWRDLKFWPKFDQKTSKIRPKTAKI